MAPRVLCAAVFAGVAAAVKVQDAFRPNMDRDRAIQVALHGEKSSHKSESLQHIKEMRDQFQLLKKSTLDQAKTEMEHALEKEKKLTEAENKREAARMAHLKELEENKKKYLIKKEVFSAKRMADEANISRPLPGPTPEQVELARTNRERHRTVMRGEEFRQKVAIPAKVNKTYIVDNRYLLAKTDGLGFRFSKNMTDKDNSLTAKWGGAVRGVDQGDGWIKVSSIRHQVGDRYLPTTVNGTPVLTFHDMGRLVKFEEEQKVNENTDKLVSMAKKIVGRVNGTAIKNNLEKALAAVGAGVEHEVEKGFHDIAQSVRQSRIDAAERHKAAKARLAQEAKLRRQELAFKHNVKEGEAEVQHAQADMKHDEKMTKQDLKQAKKELRRAARENELQLQAEFKAEKWAMSHFVKAAPGHQCPAGWWPVKDVDSCKLAVSMIGGPAEDWTHLHRSWDESPSGCFLDFDRNRVLFNQAEESAARLNFDNERICTRSTAATVRERTHQELDVQKHERHRLMAKSHAQAAAEEALDNRTSPPKNESATLLSQPASLQPLALESMPSVDGVSLDTFTEEEPANGDDRHSGSGADELLKQRVMGTIKEVSSLASLEAEGMFKDDKANILAGLEAANSS